EKDFLNGMVEVVAVNDLVTAENLAYLLQYDTTHGKLPYTVKAIGEDMLEVSRDGVVISNVKTLAKKVHPTELPWAEHAIDIVIEATGAFTKKKDASGHLAA